MSKKTTTGKTTNLNQSGGTEVLSSTKSNEQKEVSLKDFSKKAPYAFSAKNYKLLLIGLAINILGFILMIGGAAEDPNEFNAEELFGTVRITIAPMFIVLGYIVILYAIMKKPKTNQ